MDPVYAGLFDPQQWNRYTYARANPLSFVDPDGRCITYVEQETADGIEGFCLGQGGAVHEVDAGVRYFGGGGWFEDTSLLRLLLGAGQGVVTLAQSIPEQWQEFLESQPLGDRIALELATELIKENATTLIAGGAVGRALTKTAGAVIGKLDDLKNLRAGERSLLDRLPNLGNPKANWAQNSSVLRQEMSRGLPIRDASIDPASGALINNTGFLRAERNLLQSHGWTYDPKTTMWYPPRR